MKANISHTANKKKKGPFGGSELRLTIGMIVKNEEATLEKCLHSLRPLLDAVPSELIITDTGSTDHTVKIAEKYTDHIIHFEWCDDFSAARNTGLKAARGEWFMTIDADEWFEDVTEIIDFFKSGECANYGTCSYKVRDYMDPAGKTYEDFHATRIHKRYPGMLFINRVHEGIAKLDPIKYFDSYAHHFGYAHKSREDLLNKSQRNTKLLKKMLDENPNDIRALLLLAKEDMGVGDIEKSIENNRKGLGIEQIYPNRALKISLQHDILRGYMYSKAYQKVLDTLEEFLAPEKGEEIDYLDFYFWSEEAAFQLGQYKKAIEMSRKYLDIYQKYQEHTLDMERLLYTDFSCIKPENKEEIIRKIVQSNLLLHDDEQASVFLKQLDLSVPHSIEMGFKAFSFAVAGRSGTKNIVSDFYDNVLSYGDKEKRDELINFIETRIVSKPELRFDMCSALSKSENSDDYVTLCRLRCAEELGDQKAALEFLDWFSKNETDWDACFFDVLFFVMKEKINILPFLLNIDMDELQYYSAEIQKCHWNFITVILEYFKVFSFKNLKCLFWTIRLKNKVFLEENNMSDEELVSFFEEYARQTALYVRSVYRSELFSPDAISILPRVYQLGYYMDAAFSAQKASNDTAYLQNLRAALSSYPLMKKPIGLLLSRFQMGSKKDDNAEENLGVLNNM